MLHNGFAASGVVEFTIPDSDFSWMRPVVGIVPAVSPVGSGVFYTPLIVSEQGDLIEVYLYQEQFHCCPSMRPEAIYRPDISGPISNGSHAV